MHPLTAKGQLASRVRKTAARRGQHVTVSCGSARQKKDGTNQRGRVRITRQLIGSKRIRAMAEARAGKSEESE